jgi:hypothetical protein
MFYSMLGYPNCFNPVERYCIMAIVYGEESPFTSWTGNNEKKVGVGFYDSLLEDLHLLKFHPLV